MRLDPDSPVMRFFARLFDLAVLQILFLLTSIPLFTIGAGLSAMYYVCRKLQQDEVSSVAKAYFEAFRICFVQSTAAWLIIAAGGLLLVLDIRYYGGGGWSLQLVISYVLGAVLYTEFLYVFPLIAWFDNRVINHFKNAPILALEHILVTVLITILYFLIIALFRTLFPLMVLLGFSTAAYIASFLLAAVFKKHGADIRDSLEVK